jgi:hypothetical protein
MRRLPLAILIAVASLLPSLRAGQGLIVTAQEEDLRSGEKTTATIYLEPHRVAVRGVNHPTSMTMAYLVDERVLRIINHERKTVIDSQRSEIGSEQSQGPDHVEQVYDIIMDRLETMDAQQRAASEHHLFGRYCQVRLAARGTTRERSKIAYSRGTGSATIGGYRCNWYVGRRGADVVSSVCAAPQEVLDATPAEFAVIRQLGEGLGGRWPSVASILHSSDPPQPNSNRYPGVAIEEIVFCNGQALLKNTILESGRTEIGADVYTAPGGYVDLTCRDQGLCN